MDSRASLAEAKSAASTGYDDLIAAATDSPNSAPPTRMPANVQAKMEAAFGADFSSVQIHHDSPRAVGLEARAFTQGEDIHFAPGLWSPETTWGRTLLGHELAHVRQQCSGRVPTTSQVKGLRLNHEASLEAEADAMAARAVRGDGMGASVGPWGTPPVAGDHAPSAGVIQRDAVDSPDTLPTATLASPTIDPPTPGFNKAGFIDNDDGANLRSGPAELGGVPLTSQPLPPTTPVFVSGYHPAAPQWWYVTVFLPTAILRGYVQGFRVNTDLPEPTAKLYQVKPGDTAERLAVQEFKASVRDGHDLRYYENVLLAVNREKGRAGVTGTFQDPGLFGTGANNVQLEAGRRIWLVSPAYARALEGIVPSGSLTGGAYAKVKRFAGHVGDILQSVTDSPKYAVEVLGEYLDAILDNLPVIIGVTAGFIAAEALSAFLAATPTGVGQLAAALIQLILALVAGTAAIEMGVEALRHAEQWLTLAWTAGGDEKKIAAASKEFLKMLVSIAIAALAVAGMRGNFGKGLKIADSLKIELPRVATTPAIVTPSGVIAPGGVVITPGSVATTGPVNISPSFMTGIGAGGSKVDPKANGNEGTSTSKQPKANGGGAKEVAERLGVDLDALEVAPGSNGGVLRTKGGSATPKEVELGDVVAALEGDKLVLPPLKNQPGIDGFLKSSGRPVQLKKLDAAPKNLPAKVVSRANEAFEAAVKHGWSGVDVYIDALGTTKQAVLARWQSATGVPAPRQGLSGALRAVRVRTADGWVDLPLPNP